MQEWVSLGSQFNHLILIPHNWIPSASPRRQLPFVGFLCDIEMEPFPFFKMSLGNCHDIFEMKAYSSLPQKGERLWVSTSVLIIIWGGFLGQWGTDAVSMSMRKEEAEGLGMCAMIHRYIPRDSRTFIPIRLPNDYSILCRVNSSASRCDWVLVASRGRSYYFKRDLKNRLILDRTGLIIIDMSKELEGEYQVLSGANRTCEAQVLLTAVGPWFHYRILLLVPGIAFLSGLGLLWDWMIKARNQLAISQEEQSANENIQHVVPPS